MNTKATKALMDKCTKHKSIKLIFFLIYISYIIEIYKCGDFVYYYDYNDNEQKLGRLRAIVLNEEDQYRLRIQKVLDYDDLPGTFKGELRQNRSLSGEVWLQDEPFLTITTS